MITLSPSDEAINYMWELQSLPETVAGFRDNPSPADFVRWVDAWRCGLVEVYYFDPGAIWIEQHGANTGLVHAAFPRKSWGTHTSTSAVLLRRKILEEDAFTSVVAYVPETNEASISYCKRIGFKPTRRTTINKIRHVEMTMEV